MPALTDGMFLDAAVVIVILVLVFTGMALGWRARRRRQADVAKPATPPAELGDVALRDDLFYVATTPADAPLERITVHGLGFRGRAEITVAAVGIRLDIAGERPAFIPAVDLRGVGRATWTIDRAVGGSGLVFVRWLLGEAEVDSYLRPDDPAALVAAIQDLIPTDRKKEVA